MPAGSLGEEQCRAGAGDGAQLLGDPGVALAVCAGQSGPPYPTMPGSHCWQLSLHCIGEQDHL